MPSLAFTVAADRCIQCDACVKDCPSHIILRQGKIPSISPSSEENCIKCQHCLAVCPTAAISIFGLKPENSLPLTEGILPSYQQMKTFVRGRRSFRQFRNEDVPVEQINALLADLAHAPTGCNDCDLTFSVVDNRASIERLLERLVTEIEKESNAALPEFIVESAAAYRRDGTDNFFRGAPHLLIVSPGSKATCGQEDAVLTLSCFDLLAQSAGIGTTWCGILKLVADAVPGVRAILGLEPNAYFYAMMFGLPAVKYARTVQRDTAAQIRRIKG
ncbi:MAG: nitroreductase family protein [Planctomycetaceae bacterium]|jgi:ferredoxin|nr:nitroreductase family protein [Planctomycetaceae bacterium]